MQSENLLESLNVSASSNLRQTQNKVERVFFHNFEEVREFYTLLKITCRYMNVPLPLTGMHHPAPAHAPLTVFRYANLYKTLPQLPNVIAESR